MGYVCGISQIFLGIGE